MTSAAGRAIKRRRSGPEQRLRLSARLAPPRPQHAALPRRGRRAAPGPAVRPPPGQAGGSAPAQARPERAGTRAGDQPGGEPRARRDGGRRRRPGPGLAAAAGAARGRQVAGGLGPAAARPPRHAAAQGRRQEGPVQGLLRPQAGPHRLHERPGLLERRHLAAGFEYISLPTPWPCLGPPQLTPNGAENSGNGMDDVGVFCFLVRGVVAPAVLVLLFF